MRTIKSVKIERNRCYIRALLFLVPSLLCWGFLVSSLFKSLDLNLPAFLSFLNKTPLWTYAPLISTVNLSNVALWGLGLCFVIAIWPFLELQQASKYDKEIAHAKRQAREEQLKDDFKNQ